MLGKVLNERYKIIKELGKGGMAIVYEAQDLLLDRKVALKMLRPEYISDKDFVDKFRHEAKAVAKISHPNVVSIFDIARDGDYHYLVMENITGKNLKDIIKERGQLSITESLDIAKQICTALVVAHENNIIHCDIKPHNILINKNKQVRVTDFGIARAVTSSTITTTDTIMGSAHYFSPEQAKGGEIKTYSDLYSVGVVLYEMLTGEVPFNGESPISVALKHIQEKPKKPSLLNPRITEEIDNLVLKALAKDPRNRFKEASQMKKEIVSALKSLKKSRPRNNRVIDSHPEDTKILKKYDFTREGNKHSTKVTRPRQSKKVKEDGKRKWLIWSGIILLIIILGIGGLLYFFKLYTDVPVVEVPDVVGMNMEEAKSEASQVGLDIEKQNDGVYHSQIPEGNIISQSPKGGERVRQTRKLIVTVSKGPQIVKAPDLANKTLREARILLGNKEITIEEIEYEYSDQISKNRIISQSPEPGEELGSEKKMKLVVSQGMKPEMVPVPNLIGLPEKIAYNKIEGNNLEIGTIKEEMTKRFKEGQIANQQYEVGKQVPKGSKIDLTVSKGLINRENATTHTSTVGVDVLGFERQEIKIVVIDNNGRDVVYQAIHKPGDYVSQTINSVGPTEFQVYIDGELVKQKSIGS